MGENVVSCWGFVRIMMLALIIILLPTLAVAVLDHQDDDLPQLLVTASLPPHPPPVLSPAPLPDLSHAYGPPTISLASVLDVEISGPYETCEAECDIKCIGKERYTECFQDCMEICLERAGHVPSRPPRKGTLTSTTRLTALLQTFFKNPIVAGTYIYIC